MIAAPIAVVVAGAAAGAASGVAIEYVLSRGQADRGDYIVAGTVGALPGGLGARGTITLVSKLSKLRHFSRRHGDTVVETALVYAHRGSPVFLGSEVVGITSGLAGGYAVGQLYDHFKSRGGEHTSRSGTPSAGLSTPGPSAQNKSRASRNKPRRMISRANRRGAPSSGRRRPRTPYCRTHKKRHWCKFTRR